MEKKLIISLFILVTVVYSYGKEEIWNRGDTVTGWKRMEKRLKTGVNYFLDTFGYLAEDRKFNVSWSCRKDLVLYFQELRQLKIWAVMMLDSTAKLPSGIMHGRFSDIGAYDECVSILHKKPSGDQVQGQYCSLNLYPPLPNKPRFYPLYDQLKELKQFSKEDTAISYLSRIAQFFYSEPLRWSICLPSACSLDDVQILADRIAEFAELTAKVTNCETKTPIQLSPDQKFAIAVLGTILVITILGTYVDINLSTTCDAIKTTSTRFDSNGKMIGLARCFSLSSNASNLFDVSGLGEGIPVLHGIRVLTIVWIIVGHTYLYMNYQLYGNLSYFRESMKGLLFQAISNATLSVDTFYLLSGLLTSYLSLKFTLQRNVKFNVPLFLLYRFWRLTPAYMLVICLTLLVPIFGAGPLWKECVTNLADDCRNYWWTNLLYINNIVVPDRQCLPHSWYLPVDMQFHIISVLFFLPMFSGNIILGKLVALFLTTIGTIVTGVVTYKNQYPPTELHIHPDQEARMEMKSDVYFMIYPHMGAYCIGLLVGYHLRMKRIIFLSKRAQVAGWFLSTTAALCILFGIYDWNRGNLPTPVISALYAALHRTVWGLCVAWLILACTGGYGGFVNKFLRWKAFAPLSRVTFLAFLLHPFMLWTHAGLTQERFYYSHYYILHKAVGHIVLSYCAAIVCSLLFEAPFKNMYKVVFGGRERKQFNQSQREVNGNSKHVFQNGYMRNVGD